MIRNRYLRNNRHAAKLSRTLRSYYYTGFIGLGLILVAAFLSVTYVHHSFYGETVSSRRALADTGKDIAPVQRRRLSKDAVDDGCDHLGSSDKKHCDNLRCSMNNFCRYQVRPGPKSEFERDFLYPSRGWARTEAQCSSIPVADFVEHYSADLGDLQLAKNETHVFQAQDHLWCEWNRVTQNCEHSGRFCYMLHTKALCETYCPSFEWFNMSQIGALNETGTYFDHLFVDAPKLILDLKAGGVKGICNGTGNPFVKVEHINHECISGVGGVWFDFPSWLNGLPDKNDLHTRDTGTAWAGTFFWAVLVFYGFIGIAIVCDEFFEPSLTIISDNLKLNPDVAGATFMAIGSSAPEFFSSLMDVFVFKNNVGLGTIVGSAMFNILVIVGVSALFATVCSGEKKKTLAIDWRPVVRDVSFYSLSIILIVACFWDSHVMWYEGLALVMTYVVYIIVMIYNHKLMGLCPNEEEKNAKKNRTEITPSPAPAPKQEKEDDVVEKLEEADKEKTKERDSGADADRSTAQPNENAGDDDDDDDDESLWDLPPTCQDNKVKCCVGWFWYILKAPWLALFTITIPHCDKCPKLYWLTFSMCIFWMGGLCFFEVMLCTFIGCNLEVDPTVLGITLLAIGTSVPDALASIIVARNGEGDMAIANAVGSNVFDMLLGLGLPWFLGDLVFRVTKENYGPCGLNEGISVNRDGILVSTFILLATVGVYATVLSICKCHLNAGVAVGLFIWYVLYLGITITSEFCAGGFSWKMDNHNCDPHGGSIFSN